MIRLRRWYRDGTEAPSIHELEDLAEARVYVTAFAADQIGVDANAAWLFGNTIAGTIGETYTHASGSGIKVRLEIEPVCVCGHYEYEHVPMLSHPETPVACFHRVDRDDTPPTDQKWCSCESYTTAPQETPTDV